MGNSRKRFLVLFFCVCIVLVVNKLALGVRNGFAMEAVTGVFCLLLLAPALRNNKIVVGAMVVTYAILYCVACVSVILFLVRGQTFWYTFELKHGAPSQNLFMTAVRICNTPLPVMFASVQLGFDHKYLVVLGSLMLLIGTTVLAFMVFSSHAPATGYVLMVIWGFGPGFYAIVMLNDNEKHIRQTQHLTKAHLDQQGTAAANQQRTVGYIFHEVRNPINNIMLACELMRAILKQPSAPTSSYTGSPLLPLKSTSSLASEVSTNSSKWTRTTLRPSIIEEVGQLVDDIHQSASAAVRVLNDSLNLQRLQSGTFEFVHKSFRLDDLVSSTVKMVQPQMLTKGIKVTMTVEHHLQGVSVEGDFHRLQQVLLNYLSNAYKFTPPEGRIEVKMKQVSKRGENTSLHVRTSVHNTGEGIKPEHRDRLFQPWAQIRAGDQQQQGSGLGLALCKAFVEKGHNGTVGFESEYGNGSEFFFDILFPRSVPKPPPTPLEHHFGLQPNPNQRVSSATKVFSKIMRISSANTMVSSTASLEMAFFAPQLDKYITPSAPHSLSEPTTSSTTYLTTLSSPTNTLGNRNSEENTNPTNHDRNPSPHNNISSNNVTYPNAKRNNTDNNINNSNNDNIRNNTTEEVSISGLLGPLYTSPVAPPRPSALIHRTVDVLIVEDSAMSRRLLTKTLTSLGVTSEQVMDGLEAVQRIQKVGNRYYAVVLMDKEMPRMDGYEATRKIREMGFDRAIIGCTGNVMDFQVEEFIKAGVNHVLSKPVTQEGIASSLQRAGVATNLNTSATTANHNTNHNNINNNNNSTNNSTNNNNNNTTGSSSNNTTNLSNTDTTNLSNTDTTNSTTSSILTRALSTPLDVSQS